MNKIFLGHTPKKNANYLYNFLKNNKKFKRVIIPCVGEFTLPYICVKAGYKPDQLYCSDISLFSSLLGFFYADNDIEILKVEIDEYRIRGKKETRKIAEILVCMKILQYKGVNYYEQQIIKELKTNAKRYEDEIINTIEKNKDLLHGIKYEIADMRKVIGQDGNESDLYIINPPAYKNGYEKMYSFQNKIKWINPDVSGFDWDKEIEKNYLNSTKAKSLFLWFIWKRMLFIPENRYLFLNEKNKYDRYYWVVNKDVETNRFIFQYGASNHKIKQYKMIEDDYVITDKTIISCIICDKYTAYYYRDLFVKKMKDTESECYVLIALDGKLFGVVGLHLSNMFMKKNGELHETYGFNKTLKLYKNVNRLLMMIITSRQFAEWLRSNYEIDMGEAKELHTTCLSKYRKLKINNGLLEIVSREKLGTLYKLKYVTKIYERSYKDVIKIYLEENNDGNSKQEDA